MLFSILNSKHDGKILCHIQHVVQGWVDVGCICVFAADLIMRGIFTGKLFQDASSRPMNRKPINDDNRTTTDHCEVLTETTPFHNSMVSVYSLMVCILMTVSDFATRDMTAHQWSGVARPAIVFYYSEAA